MAKGKGKKLTFGEFKKASEVWAELVRRDEVIKAGVGVPSIGSESANIEGGIQLYGIDVSKLKDKDTVSVPYSDATLTLFSVEMLEVPEGKTYFGLRVMVAGEDHSTLIVAADDLEQVRDWAREQEIINDCKIEDHEPVPDEEVDIILPEPTSEESLTDSIKDTHARITGYTIATGNALERHHEVVDGVYCDTMWMSRKPGRRLEVVSMLKEDVVGIEAINLGDRDLLTTQVHPSGFDIADVAKSCNRATRIDISSLQEEITPAEGEHLWVFLRGNEEISFIRTDSNDTEILEFTRYLVANQDRIHVDLDPTDWLNKRSK